MLQDLLAGVDIGGTKTAVVIARVPPEVLRRIEFATEPKRGPQPAIAKVNATLHDLHANNPKALKAIGVSCGGPLNRRMGVIQAPPNLST